MVTSTTDSISGNSPTSLIKSDTNGVVDWSYRFGQSPYFVSNIAEAADSSVLIAFSEDQSTDDQKEIHTMKLDVNGNMLLSKIYELPSPYITGASAPTIMARNNGAYYLTSIVADSITMRSNLHVMSFDANGNVLWSNTYDSATGHIDGAFLDTCANGDLFVATSSSIGVGTEICVDIMRVTTTGNLLWYKHLILPNYHLRIKSLVATSADSFYLVSSMYSPFTTLPELSVILANGYGSVLWSQRYNPPGVPWYVKDAAIDENNQLVVSGLVEHSVFSDGSIVCMLNSFGQVLYSQYSPWFYYTSVDYRGNGLFSVAGSGGMAFENPVYVLFDSTLHGCADIPFGVFGLNQSLSYTNGFGSSPMIVSVNTDSISQVTGNITSILHCPPVGVEENSDNSLQIYPIPVQDKLTIETEIIPELIVIYDVTGKLRYSQSQCSLRTELEVGSWTSGIYLVQIIGPNTNTTRNIIVE